MIELDGFPPVKVHAHPVGTFVLKSEKLMVPPAVIMVLLAEKLATGTAAPGGLQHALENYSSPFEF